MNDESGRIKKALEAAVCGAVSGREVAVAFSGGLDSGIIAAIAKEYAREATLYTAGSEGSHDIRVAESSAEELGMRLVRITMTEDGVLESLREMIRITGTKDPVTLSFELPLFFVCRDCKEGDIIGGQGADELFAGYSKYIGLDGDALKKMMADDMRKLSEVTLPHEEKVAAHFGKKVHYPFLDERVAEEAAGLSIDRIMPDGDPASRKKVLRDISRITGYAGISSKEKKAAQYGSGAMTVIRRICRNGNTTYAELIESLCKEIR
ncbi:MAG: asparagine synthase [Candidatus Methanoplasma sp.]|jgi:asparagine synthase (glutamine-hydrolysing)|nr:asparagine synthase [Candidatus Methanoplasma sp.]